MLNSDTLYPPHPKLPVSSASPASSSPFVSHVFCCSPQPHFLKVSFFLSSGFPSTTFIATYIYYLMFSSCDLYVRERTYYIFVIL